MRALIGVHIPKTAGTSLRYAIEEATSEGSVAYVYRTPPGVSLSGFLERHRDGYGGPSVIYGHMGFGLHEKLGIEARYFTVLRHPLARALSLYRHERRVSGALFEREARKLGLTEFFRHRLSPQFDNSMTRMLAGQLWQEEQWYLEGGDGDLLERAKCNLENCFEFIGLSETLADQISELEGLLGVSLQLGHHNVDPEPIESAGLTREERAVIEDRFALDLALYDHARGLCRSEGDG